MPMTVWKYPLEVTDVQTIPMPRHAKPLAVQTQDGVPAIWAMVDPNEPRVDVRVRIYGTGHEIDEPWLTYAGTFQMYGGATVFHVFYGPSDEPTA